MSIVLATELEGFDACNCFGWSVVACDEHGVLMRGGFCLHGLTFTREAWSTREVLLIRLLWRVLNGSYGLHILTR